MISYTQYLTEAFNNFETTHKGFMRNWHIDSYDNWHYRQVCETLVFQNSDADKLTVKYTPIGTFDTTNESWLWSWANEYSIEASQHFVKALIDIGLTRGYEKLHRKRFHSHKDEGWEFLAIAWKELGGIGGYRVESGTLLKYMLVDYIMDDEEIQWRKNRVILCDVHGESRHAFVCQHLNLKSNEGFQEAFDTYKYMPLDEETDLQAWCNKCEQERRRTGGWNSDSMKTASIKLVCEECYFNIKTNSLKV